MREVVDYLKFIGVEELDVYSTDSDIKTFFGIPNEKMFILIMGNMVNGDEVEKFDVKIDN